MLGIKSQSTYPLFPQPQNKNGYDPYSTEAPWSLIFFCVSIQHCVCSLQYILHSVIVTDISKNMPPTVPSVVVCQVGLAREYPEN